MNTISWQDFESVDIRIGTIVDVQDFPEIRNPSYKVWVDFGSELGARKRRVRQSGVGRIFCTNLELAINPN